MFFRDGVRRVDFVLSYIDDKDGERKQVGRELSIVKHLQLYKDEQEQS